MIDNSVHTQGSGNWVVAHSAEVAQQSHRDARDDPDFAVALAGSAEGGRAFKITMRGGPQLLSVSVDVAVLEPQEGITASVIGGGTRRMVRDFARKVVLHMQPANWTADVYIDVIATCVDIDRPDRSWVLHRALRIHRPVRVSRAQGRIPVQSTEARQNPVRGSF